MPSVWMAVVAMSDEPAGEVELSNVYWDRFPILAFALSNCVFVQAEDVKKVVEFCRDNRPQAIFVGARNLFCKALKEDMSRIGDFILDAHAQVGAFYHSCCHSSCI